MPALTRVPARTETGSGSIRRRTRNISKTGALIDVEEETAADDERLKIRRYRRAVGGWPVPTMCGPPKSTPDPDFS